MSVLQSNNLSAKAKVRRLMAMGATRTRKWIHISYTTRFKQKQKCTNLHTYIYTWNLATNSIVDTYTYVCSCSLCAHRKYKKTYSFTHLTFCCLSLFTFSLLYFHCYFPPHRFTKWKKNECISSSFGCHSLMTPCGVAYKDKTHTQLINNKMKASKNYVIFLYLSTFRRVTVIIPQRWPLARWYVSADSAAIAVINSTNEAPIFVGCKLSLHSTCHQAL